MTIEKIVDSLADHVRTDTCLIIRLKWKIIKAKI